MFLSACMGRPEGDVCSLNDNLSIFMCAASKQSVSTDDLSWQGAFFVSEDLGERGVDNLTETLIGLSGRQARVDVGGVDPEETKSVVLGALSMITEREITLKKLHVVYLGAEPEKQSIVQAFNDLGASIEYVEFSFLKP